MYDVVDWVDLKVFVVYKMIDMWIFERKNIIWSIIILNVFNFYLKVVCFCYK